MSEGCRMQQPQETSPISCKPSSCLQLVQDCGGEEFLNSVCCVNAAGISGL